METISMSVQPWEEKIICSRNIPSFTESLSVLHEAVSLLMHSDFHKQF